MAVPHNVPHNVLHFRHDSNNSVSARQAETGNEVKHSLDGHPARQLLTFHRTRPCMRMGTAAIR